MTGYDPRKYVGRDVDDKNMESSFGEISKEENRRYAPLSNSVK
jgi:hypothetical protein